MHDGVGTLTPAAPIPPTWALQMWQGPSASHGVARLWSTARDAVVKGLRPVVEWLGVVELVALFEANEAFERALMAFARSTYDRADLEVIVADPTVHAHYMRLSAIATEVTRSRPRLFGKPRARGLFPERVLRDEAVRTRVMHSVQLLSELEVAMHALRSNTTGPSELERGLETPLAERALIPCWWAYDPGVPIEIARRMVAGRRSIFLLSIVRISRRNWTGESLRRAAIDWADDTADYCGLIAALPAVTMPSVPADRRMNLAAVLDNHRQLQAQRQAQFQAGLAALRSN